MRASIVVTALMAIGSGLEAQPAVPLDQLLERVGSYLHSYETQLSSIVANERFQQRVVYTRAYKNGMPVTDDERRRLDSEIGFLRLPGGAEWLGFRDVQKINGREVNSSKRSIVDALSAAGNVMAQAQAIADASAERNLGYPRTTNLPNLPLEFLHPRNRHRLHHRIDATEKIRGIQTTLMVFQEHSTPTIIRRPEGGDMQSLVRAWVETETGRLIRAEVRTRTTQLGVLAAFDNVIRVDFRLEPKLNLFVPYEMEEVFFAGRFREGGALHQLPSVQDQRAHHHTETMIVQ